VIYEGNTIDVWFEADTPRVIEDETDYGAHHYRTKVHPLLTLMSLPPVRVLMLALGVSPVEAVTLFHSALAALWLATLFVVLRIMGCRWYEAVIFRIGWSNERGGDVLVFRSGDLRTELLDDSRRAGSGCFTRDAENLPGLRAHWSAPQR
jgi:hypothetical protein